jgi:hypothetical protein
MQVTPNFPLSRRRHLAGVTGGLARPFLAVLRSSAIGKGAFGVGILSTTRRRAASSVA